MLLLFSNLLKNLSAASVGLTCLLAASLSAELSSTPVIGIGTSYTVSSEILGEDQHLLVSLPNDYESSGKDDPVLVFPGSNWHDRFAMIASTLRYMTDMGQIPPMILVGIDLPHGNFGLIPQKEENGGTRAADDYIAMLSKEIIPFIDNTFRTNGFRIFYGASNCGIFAVYALMDGHLPVNAVIASSPMIGWNPELILAKTQQAFESTEHPGRFLYLIESDDDYERVTNHFSDYVGLLKESAPKWLSWDSDIRPNSGHVSEADIPLGLRAIFPDYNPPVKLNTLQAIVDHFQMLSERYGFEIQAPFALIHDIGAGHVFSGDLGEGQRIYEYIIENYNEPVIAYSLLGLVHRKKGEFEEAKACYKKALAIDPNHQRSLDALKELEAENK